MAAPGARWLKLLFRVLFLSVAPLLDWPTLSQFGLLKENVR